MKAKPKPKKIIAKSENILYKYCSKEWHPIINNTIQFYNFKKNETIFSERDPVKGIYIINSGKVKVFSKFRKDKIRIHRLAGEGKILGHRGFSTTNYPVSAVTLIPTTVSFISNEIFVTLIRANPDFSIYLINFFAEQLRQSEDRMKSLMLSDVKHKIADILFILIDSFGFDGKESNKLSYCLSRKDFAAMAGITYETTVRTLAYFQRRKLIKIEGKSIRIINPVGLKKYTIPY
ncbi:MAG: Transcriptional activator protein Anr [Bacteroidia bacterium]|nr:Transcriptional activator protein Anr [Bacteroidia bacterium]